MALLIEYIYRDKKKIEDILNLHLVKDRLDTNQIRRKNANSVSVATKVRTAWWQLLYNKSLQISQVATNDERKFLYFNVVTNQDNNQTVTVEGGGVNATIIEPDIAATNGFVHIIDRVLGNPFTTMLEKLRSDPMLK